MSVLKQIDIRIGAVKRLTKEMKSRGVDVETEKKRTERFIQEGEDKWTVNKQVLYPYSGSMFDRKK
jgi:Tubulin binding cofactor A